MRIALVALLSASTIAGAAVAQTTAPPSAKLRVSDVVKAGKHWRHGRLVRQGAAGKNHRADAAEGAAKDAGKDAAKDAAKDAGKGAGTTGSRPSAAQDPLASCIAMWDRGTHMTKVEWARACHRVAARINDMTLK